MSSTPERKTGEEAVSRRIRAAGRRARAEAEARRKAAGAQPPTPTEKNGRDGPEPARYGDWEVKGIASDF
jgi:hypothetical protein